MTTASKFLILILSIFPLVQCWSSQCLTIGNMTGRNPGAACQCVNYQITAKYDKTLACVTCLEHEFFNETSYSCESCPGTNYNCDPNVRSSCKQCQESSDPLNIPPSSTTVTAPTTSVTAPTATVTAPTLPSTPTQDPPTQAAKITEITQAIIHTSKPTTSDGSSVSQNTSAVNQNAPHNNISNDPESVMDWITILIIILTLVVIGALVGIACKFRISRKIKKLCCPDDENRDEKAEEEEQEHLNQKNEEISQTQV